MSTVYSVMSPKLKEFLRVGEFGLLDPRQPPSDTNPPLSNYLQRLADSGLAVPSLFKAIFSIYAFNNCLRRRTTVVPDPLINRLFREDFIRHNQELAPDRNPVDPDAFRFADFSILIAREITDQDVPTPLTDQEYATISRAIHTARQNHSLLKNANHRAVLQGQPPLQFYLPDGTTRSL